MATSAEDDVYTFLSAAGLGISFFKGPRRPAAPSAIPHQAAFILGVGGINPSPYMDGTNTAWRFFRVQIWVRSEVNSYGTGRGKADAIWSAINQATISGWTRIVCEQSAPMYLGRDDVEHHEWTVNVRLERRVV